MGIKPLLLVLLLAAPAAAGDLPGVPARRRLAATLGAAGGLAFPVGGHWGDASSGFKPSSAVLLYAAFPLRGLLSWGVELSHNPRHAYRRDPDRRLSVSSVSPFARADLPCGAYNCHALLGAGLYYWDQPGFGPASSATGGASGSSAGFSAGAGVSRDYGAFGLGLEGRWQHLFDMEGRGLDLNSADNLNAYIFVSVPLLRGAR